jgi:IclR family transcriptional regulator, acetate operon repressor
MRRVTKASAAPVGVISKVLLILEAIHGSPFGLGLKAISEATGIHKSTAHRFVKHLEREKYLISTEEGAYLIGPRFSQMTTHGNHRATLQAVARPVLSQLWKSTQETVNLAVLDQSTVLYTDVIESPHEFRLSSRVGTRRTLPATALGKAMAAFLSTEQAEQTLPNVTFQPFTPKSIMNHVQFQQELAKIRRQGYAVDDEEATLGARCVAAPILGADRGAIAAVSVSGPITRITVSHVSALARVVMNAAGAISTAMGFPPVELRAGASASGEKSGNSRK